MIQSQKTLKYFTNELITKKNKGPKVTSIVAFKQINKSQESHLLALLPRLTTNETTLKIT